MGVYLGITSAFLSRGGGYGSPISYNGIFGSTGENGAGVNYIGYRVVLMP